MLTDNPNASLILIVENDVAHAELLKMSLQNAAEEYRLNCVDTLQDARMAIERQLPDLVLTDYLLPDGCGSSLVLTVNGLCPVVLLTSYGNEQVAVDAMKAGAQDYIVKSPNAVNNLPRTIKYVLTEWALKMARRQGAEAALRAKKDWERTFDAVPELITIIDLNHTITRANKAMAERCGVTPKQLVGRKCYEVVHGLSSPLAGCPHSMMIMDGRAHSEEIEEPRCNGVFDVTVSPLTDEEGRITASVHIMRDITSHKLATRLLAENEIRLRTLVQTIPDLVWLKDVDGVYLACNRMFERFFGAREADIIGKTDYDFVERELADFFRENDRKAMEAGEPSINEEWITFRRQRSAGIA